MCHTIQQAAQGGIVYVDSNSDIEGWTDETKTTNWVTGFNNADNGSLYLWDSGDQGYNYGSGWTIYDAYYYAYGATYDIALPQIYNTGQASEWQTVWKDYPQMTFAGVTSEPGQSLSPQQAWVTLYNDVGGQVGNYLTTI